MEPEPREGSHYFDADPAVGSQPMTAVLALPEVTLELATDRGVFAYGEVDAGTKTLLLESPPAPPSGNVLDLGCGYGAIAVALAMRSPGATVWAVDVNRRALALTAANAERAGAPNVVVSHPDDVPPDVRFTRIYSNPPIRIGKQRLHELLEHWLSLLTPAGVAYLVIRRDLGADSLAQWLADRGNSVERIASRVGYRVLEVRP